jgi:hypothetical protein
MGVAGGVGKPNNDEGTGDFLGKGVEWAGVMEGWSIGMMD